MGGRYGASDDGSSDYQSRQPTDDDLADEQQTVAEAVQSVADRHQDDSDEQRDEETTESVSGGMSQHPLTAFGGRSRSGAQHGLDALADIDEGIADQVAKRLTERVKEVTDDTDS